MTTPVATEEQLDTTWKVGKHEFRSRLLVGTGKYDTFELTRDALEASGCEVVTVALRRVDLEAHSRGEKNLLDFIDTNKYTILPNTAGCFNKEDAIRICRIARELEIGDLVKVEVLSEQKTLLPDPIETLEACKVLVKDGFTVMAYTSDDPIMARKLADAGVAAIMPLGSPIFSPAPSSNSRISSGVTKSAQWCVPRGTMPMRSAPSTSSRRDRAVRLGVESTINPSGFIALASAAMKAGLSATCSITSIEQTRS